MDDDKNEKELLDMVNYNHNKKRVDDLIENYPGNGQYIVLPYQEETIRKERPTTRTLTLKEKVNKFVSIMAVTLIIAGNFGALIKLGQINDESFQEFNEIFIECVEELKEQEREDGITTISPNHRNEIAYAMACDRLEEIYAAEEQARTQGGK